MNKDNKTFREKLLNIDTSDAIKQQLLQQSICSSIGKLSLYKRIENGVLGGIGILFCAFFIDWQFVNFRNTPSDIAGLIRFNTIAGMILSALWAGVTGWQAIRGQRNDQLYSPLKAIGIIGTLFMYLSMGWWYFFTPKILADAKEGVKGQSEVVIVFAVIMLTIFLLLCVSANLLVYWKLCRESATFREKLTETQCLIAELAEKLPSKHPS